MELVIERHGQRVSVAHYFRQNGDAMRDPELYGEKMSREVFTNLIVG